MEGFTSFHSVFNKPKDEPVAVYAMHAVWGKGKWQEESHWEAIRQ